jgi:hypothetical protein
MTSPITARPALVVSERQRVRRARVTLTSIAAAITVLAAGVVLLAVLSGQRHSPVPAAPPHPAPRPHTADGWDWTGEAALAGAPMPVLDPRAAQPQDLAANPNPAVLALPRPRLVAGPLAYGLPGTPEGAIAALTVLDEAGLRGGDPHAYAGAYQATATPGAPSAEQSRLFGLLSDMRSHAGLPPAGPVTDLTITYQVVQAQVKGLRDGGHYAVVCVLGELAIDYQGRLLATGVSDCQALRYLPTSDGGGQWRISPGTAAARGADAWPGSDDSFRTGYLEVQR